MRNKLSEIWSAVLGVATLLSLLVSASSIASELTLGDASARALAQHPELAQYSAKLLTLQAQSQEAQLSPELNLGLDTSELLGTGDYAGVKSAETTLSVSSIWELGSKRQARMQQNQAQQALLQAEQEVSVRLLLSQLATQFTQTLAWQAHCALAQEGLALSQEAQDLVAERVNKAATSEAELWRAKVAVVQAKLSLSQCQVEFSASKQQLAQSMGQAEVDFDRLAGDLNQPSRLATLSTLEKQLDSSPFLQVFRYQEQAQNSELNMALSRNKADVQWQLGLTHFAASSDAALAVGVQVPLFSSRRNRSGVQQVQAQMQLTQAQLQQNQQALLGEVRSAALSHSQALLSLNSLRHEIIPLLDKAYAQAKQSYLQGRYSYSEWVNAGKELLEAKAQMIQAAQDVQLNQIAVEKIVGTAADAKHWKRI